MELGSQEPPTALESPGALIKKKKKILGLHLRPTELESPGMKISLTHHYKSTLLKCNLLRIK